MKNKPLVVEIVDDELRISIGVETLKIATENVPEGGLWDDGSYISVQNPTEWAEDVQAELLEEQEDGTTPVHLLLEEAMKRAAEQGSLAVSVQDDDLSND